MTGEAPSGSSGSLPGARGEGSDTRAGDGINDGADRRARVPRRSRRASLPAPAGSDPEPYDPPVERRSAAENDARLLGDRPPHWG